MKKLQLKGDALRPEIRLLKHPQKNEGSGLEKCVRRKSSCSEIRQPTRYYHTGRTIKEAPHDHDFIPQKVISVKDLQTSYYFSNCCGQKGFPNRTDSNAPAAFTYSPCNHSRSRIGRVHLGTLELEDDSEDRCDGSSLALQQRISETLSSQAHSQGSSLRDQAEALALSSRSIADDAEIFATGMLFRSRSQTLRARLKWTCCGASEDAAGCASRPDSDDANRRTCFTVDIPEVKTAIHGVILIATLEEYASRRDGAVARKLSELEECRKECGPDGLRNKLKKIWEVLTEKGNNQFLSEEEPCTMHMHLRGAVLEYLLGRVKSEDMQALLLLTQLNVLANRWDAQGVRVLLDQIEREAVRAHPGLESEGPLEILDVCQEAACKKHAKRNAKIDERNELAVRAKRVISLMEKEVKRFKRQSEDVDDCFSHMVDVLHNVHKPTPKVTSEDEEATKLLLLVLLRWMRARSKKDAGVRELVRELESEATRPFCEPLEMAINFLIKRADMYGDAQARSIVDEFERSGCCDAELLHERVQRASESFAGHRDYRAPRECLMRARAIAIEGQSAYSDLVCAFLEHDALRHCAFFLSERLVKGEPKVDNLVAAEMSMVKELRQRATRGDRLASDLVAAWTVNAAVRFAVEETSGKKCQEIGSSWGWELGRGRRRFGRVGADDDDVSSDGEETTSNGWRGRAESQRRHESRGWLATSTGVMSRHVADRQGKSVAETLRSGEAKGLETRGKETVSSQSAIRKGFFDRPAKKAIEREEEIVCEDMRPLTPPPPEEDEGTEDPFNKSFQESLRYLPSDDDEEYEDTVSECSETAETASIDTVCHLIELCKQPVDADAPVSDVPKDQEAQLCWKQLQMYEVD